MKFYKKVNKEWLSDDFIERIKNSKVFNDGSDKARRYWADVVKKHYIPEDMLFRYYYMIDWFSAAILQILSEGFIEKLNDKNTLSHLTWQMLYQYQNLSYEFMHKHRAKLGFHDDITFSVCVNNIGDKQNRLLDFLFKEFRSGLWDDLVFSTTGITNKYYLDEVSKIQDERLNSNLSAGFSKEQNKAEEIEDDDYKLQ